ncbi:hypothetical protein KQI84_03360 [bacterium]|nr:hypothetical protein [bacterium]
MASAPTIPIYQTNGDHAGEKIDEIFAPPEFFALATAISYVLKEFRTQKDGGALRIVSGFDRIVSGKRAEMNAMFTWYCAVAAEHALLQGNESWEASPEDFHEDARIFLARVFLAEPFLSPTVVNLYTNLFLLLKSLITKAGSEMGEEGAIKRIFCAVPRLVTNSMKPQYIKAFDADIALAAKERIDLLLHFCHKVESGNLEYCFCRPDRIKEKPNLSQYMS